MNIVRIRAGLGNQMFQYAFYLALKQRRPETKIDTSVYRYRPSHNGYELERIFDIHPDHATIAERNQMVDVGKDLLSEIRRAIGWKRHTTGLLVKEPDPSNGWYSDVLQAENSYLQGFWQSERYFADVKDQVRKDFQFALPLSPSDDALAQDILSHNSVSVHIRRGDYLKKRRVEECNICTENYYRRAVDYIIQHIPAPVFYVFSDEPAWGQAQDFFPKNTVFVSGHTGQQAYIDMQLMSLCRHHIIANSSFSWWGAWLGEYEQTLTLAPNKWLKSKPYPDILPPQWITIDVG